MGLQELRAGSNGLETQDGLTRAAGWQPAEALKTQELTRVAGWQPAEVLTPKVSPQELRSGSPQGLET